MNICFIAPPPQLSGGMRIIFHYAHAISKRHNVSIVYMPSPRTPWQHLKRILKRHILRRKDIPFNPKLSPCIQQHYLSAKAIANGNRLPPADIYISTWWETHFYLAKSSLPSWRMLYFVQGYIENSDISWTDLESTYRSACHKLVVSDWLADKIGRHSSAPISVIENSYDKNVFYTGLRQKNATPSIGFLYSESPIKNIDTAITVLNAIKQQYPGCVIRSFGSSKPRSDKILQIIDQFEHQPDASTLRELYQNCDVWLSLSHREGFNLTALEAMACGTPCICSDTGWPSTSIISGENGFLVDATDSAAITNTLLTLIDQPASDWQLLSNKAQSTAQQLDWSKSEQRFDELLQRIRSTAPDETQ